MLYPTYVGIKDDIIKTVNLASTQDECTSVFIIADDDYGIFDVICIGDFTFAERAQLKALIDYLF